ncbi:unnamed protein product [Arctogadus glacialis]
MSSDLRTRNIFFLNRIFGFVPFFLCVAGAKEPVPHNPQTLAVNAPHLYYTCPEGATAKLICSQRGAILHADDKLSHNWLYTPHAQQHCHAFVGPRHTSPGHQNNQLGVSLDEGKQDFSLTLKNVTAKDQGRYCCVAMETTRQHHKAVQRHHGHIVMLVTPRTNINISQECTMWDPQPTESSVAATLATTACIVALLSLPLIMLLVYKQRQHHRSSRRAHELVRMDSEAQGHENPVFLGGSPQPMTRTVSQIMTRQSSETGRHLLSEPGTPLTPPVHGDVFFPIHDAILESPEFSGTLAPWTP